MRLSDVTEGARLLLYSHEPLIAAAVASLKIVEQPERDMVAETNGREIFVGKLFLGLMKQEAAFVLAHEVMHVLSQHCGKRLPSDLWHLKGKKVSEVSAEDRFKLDLWARACDVLINEKLLRSINCERGLIVFPETIGGERASRYGLTPSRVLQMTEEELYERLKQGCPQSIDGPEIGSGDGQQEGASVKGIGQHGDSSADGMDRQEAGSGWGEGQHGDVVPAPDGEGLSDKDVEAILSLAAISAGSEADQFIGRELVQSRLTRPRDWKAELMEALTQPLAGGDVTWSRRNRRVPSDEVVLPAVRDWQASLAVVIDLSGSTIPYVDRFLQELKSIVSQVPMERLRVLTHTTTVEEVLDVGSNDEAWMRLDDLPLGRTGGTYYAPVAEKLLEMGDLTAVVWLTDLMPADWATAGPLLVRLGRPLVWAVPEQYVKTYGDRGRDYGKVAAIFDA